MKKKGYSLLNSFRYICLTCVLVLGFITIVGTGGDGELWPLWSWSTPPDYPPTQPANLFANAASTTQIDLSWNASTDDHGVTGYKIYRDGAYLKSVTGTSASDTGLNPNTNYCYTVSAYDKRGNESVQSIQACATTPPDYPPTTPANLIASAVSPVQIDLSWDASTDDVEVTSYNIYRDGTYLKSVTGTSTSDTGLNPDTNYCYTVSAYDIMGNESAQSNQACTRTPPDVTPPTPPTNLVARPVSPVQIDLSWYASTDDVEVTGYNIYRDGTYLKSAIGTSTSDTGLDKGTWYCYTVSAYDAVGNESTQSNQACTIICTITTIDSEGNVGEYTSIALDSADNVHISYYDYTNGDIKYATNASGAWVIESIDSQDNVGWYTSIALDSADNVHISYHDATNGDIKYATNASGAWVIATIDSYGYDTSIALDSADNVHISYYDAQNDVLKYATNASGAWVIATIDSQDHVGWYTSIALDSADDVHISYFDYPNSDLKYATNASGAWVIEPIDSQRNVGWYTSIALDSADNVHISYYASSNGELKYATNASGAWVIEPIDSEGIVGYYTSIEIDSADNVHISYYHAQSHDLKYATNASGAWVIVTIDSEGIVGQYTSIALDSADDVHISYYDYTNADLKYATNR